jgi:hypothetical protein
MLNGSDKPGVAPLRSEEPFDSASGPVDLGFATECSRYRHRQPRTMP